MEVGKEDWRPLTSATLDTPLSLLELSIRTNRCLASAGVRTVRELLAYSANELLAIKQLRPRSVTELREILGDLGLSLRDELQ